MKKFLILFLSILLLLPPYQQFSFEIKNMDARHSYKNIDSPPKYPEDAAHFKYYENDSHIIYWYEWWYANLKGEKDVVVMFFTVGDLNNAFSRLLGVFVAFFDERESIEMVTSNPLINYSLDYEKCNISIGGNRFYEDNGIFIIEYRKKDFKLFMKIFPYGIPFGNKAKLEKWEWTSWYVAVPYGKGEAYIEYNGKKYFIKGNAYHDHNWGISKHDIKWNWGEFCCGDFAIIYGIAGQKEMKGGIHFVNNSTHIFTPCIKLEYLEWDRISGFKKPVKIYLKGENVDFIVELEKAYIIGYKNVGKPYLKGRAHGKINGKFFDSVGFYEYHHPIK